MEPLWNAGVKPEASQQIINLGGMDNITINDAAEKLLNIMGSGEKIYLENRYEVHEAFSTWQKSMDILGYNENISFEDGLLEMWEWAKIQPKRNQKVWSSYELTKGLYSYWEV
jgi:nucleoside-diphosphate-sugar epimerase